MKIAIITITEDAQKLANSLLEVLKLDPTVISVKIFNKNVKKALNNAFDTYDCIIGIMATGIMVRNTCALIKNKIEDPAILVMDDQGKHVISLLSGHFGGANDITLKIAEISGADPVITTATDIHGKLGIDSLAKKYYLDIDDYKKIKTINSALIDSKKVDLYVPSKFEFIFEDSLVKESYNEYESLNDELKAVFKEESIILKPKKIVFGIGARKGVSKSKVQHAVNEAAKLLKLFPERIDSLATAEIKENEQGIVENALDLNIPLEIVKIDQIKSFNHPDCSFSEFVDSNFGIPGVCEPAALIAAGENSRLILKKKSYNGVTVAAAVSYN
ncbi:MAG TPA: cobalt-precorrin 5A hydrolase [Methanobacterium sp.]|nr:cobalt-precorrin 5A hydrolase [Methanobacterium sp.]